MTINRDTATDPTGCPCLRVVDQRADIKDPLSTGKHTADVDSIGQRALAAGAREDRLRERRDLQNSHAERGDDRERLNRVDAILRLRDHGRQRRDVAIHELLEDHQERDGHNRHERVLDE